MLCMFIIGRYWQGSKAKLERKGSVKDANLSCCIWTWGSFIYVHGMENADKLSKQQLKQWQHYTAQQLQTLLATDEGKIDVCVFGTRASLTRSLRSARSELTVHWGGEGVFGRFLAFFTSNLLMSPLRNEVVVEKWVWEWEVWDIFRQGEQVVPRILQPRARRKWECTVYSEELRSNNPETHVCSLPSGPDSEHAGHSRQQDNSKKLI